MARPLLPLMVVAALVVPAAAQQSSPKKSGRAPTEADLVNAKPGRFPLRAASL